ncbi:putative zinc-binding metallopeptidase [Cellvibrio sp.]|uniref:zinc-binding metallopeptidase family protein n=1 Tax=Cellvibrio sp. TaxID=1965322 RepID=UPI00396480F8
MALWTKIESEKRRLIYSLLSLSLPLTPQSEDAPELAFDFLAESTSTDVEVNPVLTGHANGLITLNINEADSAYREKMREQMAEPYRTLLGHFRHESGHYYWDVLVRDSDWLEEVRNLFGDDTLDYSVSLKAYYENGPAENWQLSYVSAYASSHPWEDWAETWAHYLHIVDTLETARDFGLQVHPRLTDSEELQAEVELNPYRTKNFRDIIDNWLPLTYALNSLNRSMGHEHAYPFVLSELVIQKMDLIHRIVQKNMHRIKSTKAAPAAESASLGL